MSVRGGPCDRPNAYTIPLWKLVEHSFWEGHEDAIEDQEDLFEVLLKRGKVDKDTCRVRRLG